MSYQILDAFLLAFVLIGGAFVAVALRFGIRPPPAPPPTFDEFCGISDVQRRTS